MTYDYRATDAAFTVFLGTADLDTVRLEQTAHFSPDEWHVLARDRRRR